MSQTKKVSQSYEKAGECVSELPCEQEFHTRKLKMRIINVFLGLLLLGVFFNGCGNLFSILDDGSEVKESKYEKYIVTRKVKLEELVGTWRVDEKSKDEYLRGFNFFYMTDKEKKYKKDLDESYLLIKKNASVKYKYIKEYKGKVRSSNYIEEVYNHMSGISKDVQGNAFVDISYEKELSKDSLTLDCIEIDGILYLGEKYETGDIDAGDLKKYHLLYKKVKKVNR